MTHPARLIPLLVLALPACSAVRDAQELLDPDPPTPPPPTQLELDAAARTWVPIGHSVRGKPLQAATIGHGTQRIYVIGGVHGDEPEGPAVAGRLPDLLAAGPALAHATFRILQDLNPDGTQNGAATNTRSVDLDRNWPAANFRRAEGHGAVPASELETAAAVRDLGAFKPDVIVILRSTPLGPRAWFDGRVAGVTQRLVSAARDIDPRWRVAPSPGPVGPGSIRAWAQERLIPVVTVELARGGDTSAALAAGLAALPQGSRP